VGVEEVAVAVPVERHLERRAGPAVTTQGVLVAVPAATIRMVRLDQMAAAVAALGATTVQVAGMAALVGAARSGMELMVRAAAAAAARHQVEQQIKAVVRAVVTEVRVADRPTHRLVEPAETALRALS